MELTETQKWLNRGNLTQVQLHRTLSKVENSQNSPTCWNEGKTVIRRNDGNDDGNDNDNDVEVEVDVNVNDADNGDDDNDDNDIFCKSSNSTGDRSRYCSSDPTTFEPRFLNFN